MEDLDPLGPPRIQALAPLVDQDAGRVTTAGRCHLKNGASPWLLCNWPWRENGRLLSRDRPMSGKYPMLRRASVG